MVGDLLRSVKVKCVLLCCGEDLLWSGRVWLDRVRWGPITATVVRYVAARSGGLW
jgi:hypothetical protein